MKIDWKFWLGAVLFVVLAICVCGCKTPTDPQPDPTPVPDGDMTVIWRGPNQVEFNWVDMPVTVKGGSEDLVFRRTSHYALPTKRIVLEAQSFIGLDRGDVVEADVFIYGDHGEVIYRRSLHKELGELSCYDAYDSQGTVLEAHNITIILVCRVNGPNTVYGYLSARCHFAATLWFDEE